jgi:rhodanese-related sulfurtransferase
MTVRTIERHEVQRLMREGAQVLDARPPKDFFARHLSGATNVPIQEFSKEPLEPLDRSRPTVTYCADNECDLSARLALRLVVEGFSDVYEYERSLADWSAFGLPLEGEQTEIALAGDLVREDFLTCAPDERVAAVKQRAGERTCLVTDEDGILLGRVDAGDLDGDSAIRDLMDTGPSTFRPDVPLSKMAEWFERRPKVAAFIITTPDARPVGVLYRSDVELWLGKPSSDGTGARRNLSRRTRGRSVAGRQLARVRGRIAETSGFATW